MYKSTKLKINKNAFMLFALTVVNYFHCKVCFKDLSGGYTAIEKDIMLDLPT